MGIPMFNIHLCGAPGFLQHLFKIAKSFVKPKIMDRVMFHESVEELHKYIPKKYLPSDFGGEMPSMNECVGK